MNWRGRLADLTHLANTGMAIADEFRHHVWVGSRDITSATQRLAGWLPAVRQIGLLDVGARLEFEAPAQRLEGWLRGDGRSAVTGPEFFELTEAAARAVQKEAACVAASRSEADKRLPVVEGAPAGGTQSDTPAPSPDLSPDELAVLNIIAEHEAAKGSEIRGMDLYVAFVKSCGKGDDRKDVLAVVQALGPTYVERIQPPPHDWYRLTTEGWLRCRYADDIRDLVAGTLVLMHDKLFGEHGSDGFTWQELKPRLAVSSVVSQGLACLLLKQLGLSPGAIQHLFLMPPEAAKLDKLRTLDDLMRHHEWERAAKQAEEEKMAAAWASAGELSGGSGVWDDLVSAPAVNVHFHPGSKVETNNASITNSVFGALSQGESSHAGPSNNAQGTSTAVPGEPVPTPPSSAEDSSASQRGAGAVSYSAQIQGSTLGASAQGPGSRAVGIVNQYGLGYADVREIVDERVALAVDRLREAVGQAHGRSMEDMLRVSFAVIQSLVAAKLSTPPDAASVADFLRAAVEDPAFPARASRLFQEGAKTPSAARRQMLARALFGIPATTPERDRVDAAIERLFPEDVVLLRKLVSLAEKGIKDHVYFRILNNGRASALRHGFQGHVGGIILEPFDCNDWPLFSLQTAGCVSFGPSPEVISGWKDITKLIILPLGHAVLVGLEGAGLGGFDKVGEQ